MSCSACVLHVHVACDEKCNEFIKLAVYSIYLLQADDGTDAPGDTARTSLLSCPQDENRQ